MGGHTVGCATSEKPPAGWENRCAGHPDPAPFRRDEPSRRSAPPGRPRPPGTPLSDHPAQPDGFHVGDGPGSWQHPRPPAHTWGWDSSRGSKAPPLPQGVGQQCSGLPVFNPARRASLLPLDSTSSDPFSLVQESVHVHHQHRVSVGQLPDHVSPKASRTSSYPIWELGWAKWAKWAKFHIRLEKSFLVSPIFKNHWPPRVCPLCPLCPG